MVRPPIQWSLRTQIGAALVVLTTVAASATALVFYRSMAEELADFEQTRLQGEARLLSRDWNLRWQALSGNVEFLAQTPPIPGLMRARRNRNVDPIDGSTTQDWIVRLETIFESMMQSHRHYLQVRLIGFDDDGRELVRVQRDRPDGPITIVRGEALQAKGDEPYMVEAARVAREAEPGAARNQAIFSQITLNRENGRITQPATPTLRAMALARDSEGLPFGVIVINLGPTGIFEEGADEIVPGRHYLVTNESGQLLFDSRPGPTFAFEAGEDAGLRSTSPALRAVLSDDGAYTSFAETDGSILEAAETAAFPGDADRFMVVLVRTGRADARALALATLGEATVPIALVLVVTLFAGLLIGQRATRPFVDLSRQISRSGGEEPGRILTVPAAPEAALVAEAFNRSGQRLAHTVEELRKSNEELDRFATLASHDLQEPARTVQSFSSILAADYAERLDDDGRQMLAFLSEAGARMQAQIRALLTYSRLGHDPERTVVDCNALLAEVQADLAVAIAEAEAEIQTDQLPTVTGCEPELRLLFQNLISNAIKFRKPGTTPVVSIRCPGQSPPHFVVKDNGVGVPESARASVFGLFKRAHATSDFAGTGVGLAHCRKIVESHGGLIWIGDADTGTEVHFTLGLPDPARTSALAV